jgi:hypothetical protein
VLTPSLLTAFGVKYTLTVMKAGCVFLSPNGYKSYGWLDPNTRAVTVQAHFSPPDAVGAYLLSAQRTPAQTLYDDSSFNRDPLGSFEAVMQRYGPSSGLNRGRLLTITYSFSSFILKL